MRAVLSQTTGSCSNSTNSSCATQPSSQSIYYLPPLPSCCSRCNFTTETALNQTDTSLSLEVKLQEIHRSLTLDKTSLSGAQRRKTSAEDHRVSATATGSAGVLVLAAIIGSIVFMDVSTALGLKFFRPSDVESEAARRKKKKDKKKKKKKRMQQGEEAVAEETPKVAWE